MVFMDTTGHCDITCPPGKYYSYDLENNCICVDTMPTPVPKDTPTPKPLALGRNNSSGGTMISNGGWITRFTPKPTVCLGGINCVSIPTKATPNPTVSPNASYTSSTSAKGNLSRTGSQKNTVVVAGTVTSRNTYALSDSIPTKKPRITPTQTPLRTSKTPKPKQCSMACPPGMKAGYDPIEQGCSCSCSLSCKDGTSGLYLGGVRGCECPEGLNYQINVSPNS
jgi:hypothetical protein